MALRDSDGKITIDEVAAEKDIKQLRISIENMEGAIAELDEILAESDEFSGDAGAQIKEVATALRSNIKKSIQSTEEAIAQIQNTVAKYQRIDAEVKNIFNAGIQ